MPQETKQVETITRERKVFSTEEIEEAVMAHFKLDPKTEFDWDIGQWVTLNSCCVKSEVSNG
jgi:hypothetical protein